MKRCWIPVVLSDLLHRILLIACVTEMLYALFDKENTVSVILCLHCKNSLRYYWFILSYYQRVRVFYRNLTFFNHFCAESGQTCDITGHKKAFSTVSVICRHNIYRLVTFHHTYLIKFDKLQHSAWFDTKKAFCRVLSYLINMQILRCVRSWHQLWLD